jgi:hypothetical protein
MNEPAAQTPDASMSSISIAVGRDSPPPLGRLHANGCQRVSGVRAWR